ncbi:MAG: CoA-binding protein [Paracoccaceae bacterium]
MTVPDPPSDSALRSILAKVKSVALVGVSTNPVRPSYYVGRYLGLKGYKVLPVNPVYAGQSVFGAEIAPSLAALAARGERVDMVDIFRRSAEAGAVVDEALEHLLDHGLKVIWMQIGVVDEDAAARARAAGVEVVMNLCPKMEYQRLHGELSMGGFNTGRLSSKLT